MSTPTTKSSASPPTATPPTSAPSAPNSCDLLQIAAWLKRCGITTVAMESTGIYWIPLFELLESRGFEVCLIEAGQASLCGARPKTDVLDAQWLQRLHSHGLLRASFRPPDLVIALRAYLRQRRMLISYAGTRIQHMQKALKQIGSCTRIGSWPLSATRRRGLLRESPPGATPWTSRSST